MHRDLFQSAVKKLFRLEYKILCFLVCNSYGLMQQRMGLLYKVRGDLFGCWLFIVISDVDAGSFRGIISFMIYAASFEVV